jgi:hypothetical protein
MCKRIAAALVLLAAGTAARGQTYPLAESVKEGDCFRYQLQMKLSGEMKVHKEGKVVAVPLSAAATHAFAERALVVSPAGLVEKSARAYEYARASITAGGEKSERTLREARNLVVAQRHKDRLLVYCPAGPLTRPELELTGEHFDTLFLTGVLPGRPVKVGETWKLSNAVVQALCHFAEGLTEQKLTGKLDRVEGDTAFFSVSGTAAGVEQGAVVKARVEASGTFDLKAARLTSLGWDQKDERDQGPANPASSVETSVRLTRRAVGQPKTLSDTALVGVPPGFSPPERLTYLEYRDPKGRFALAHVRDWVLVGETGEHTVLRLMDNGEFIAQLTVTPWKPAKKGEHLSPEEFKKAMDETSGWRPARAIQEGPVPSEDGRWVYRYSVQGRLEGVAVLQNFYLVAGGGGEQVVLTFTMTPKQADKLGARDLALAGSVEVPAKK